MSGKEFAKEDFISEEFSMENFESLGKACYQIGKYIEELFSSGYDTLIIPSRGAWPLVSPAIKICNYIGEQKGKESSVKGIKVSSLLKSEMELTSIKDSVNLSYKNKIPQIVVAPLTADVNIFPEFIGIKKERDELNEEFTEEIRSYGAHLINSFYKDPSERKKDPYFRFFDFILRECEGRRVLAKEYEEFPPIKKAVLIDTVISGRAFTTVMRNLIELGKQPFSLIVADKNGEKLKKEYIRYLREWEYTNKLYQIKVNRILSEDRGAGLLGVAGIIYPQLMSKFKKYLSPIGAVTWYPLDSLSSYFPSLKECFSLYEKTLFEATKVAWVEESSNIVKDYRKNLEKYVKAIQESIRKYNILKIMENNFRLPLHAPLRKVYETRAHVIHIIFPDEYVKKLEKKYKDFKLY